MVKNETTTTTTKMKQQQKKKTGELEPSFPGWKKTFRSPLHLTDLGHDPGSIEGQGDTKDGRGTRLAVLKYLTDQVSCEKRDVFSTEKFFKSCLPHGKKCENG